MLDRVGYNYANAQLGLELGRTWFTFYLHAGISRITGTVHNLSAETMSQSSGTTSVTFSKDPDRPAVDRLRLRRLHRLPREMSTPRNEHPMITKSIASSITRSALLFGLGLGMLPGCPLLDVQVDAPEVCLTYPNLQIPAAAGLTSLQQTFVFDDLSSVQDLAKLDANLEFVRAEVRATSGIDSFAFIEAAHVVVSSGDPASTLPPLTMYNCDGDCAPDGDQLELPAALATNAIDVPAHELDQDRPRLPGPGSRDGVDDGHRRLHEGASRLHVLPVAPRPGRAARRARALAARTGSRGASRAPVCSRWRPMAADRQADGKPMASR